MFFFTVIKSLYMLYYLFLHDEYMLIDLRIVKIHFFLLKVLENLLKLFQHLLHDYDNEKDLYSIFLVIDLKKFEYKGINCINENKEEISTYVGFLLS